MPRYDWAAKTFPMWARFDPIAVEFLNRLHDRHPVHFVLITTWKLGIDLGDETARLWIDSAFVNAGFRGELANEWKTKDDLQRATGVQEYLSRYEYKDFLIIDDTNYRFNEILGKKRFVQTHSEDGLLWKHMKDILSITGQWLQHHEL